MRRGLALCAVLCCYIRFGTLTAFSASLGPFVETQRIALDGAARFENFGYSIAADEGLLISGATNSKDESGNSVGATYVYRQTNQRTWNQIARLNPSDGQNNAVFGNSVSLDGDVAIIGAKYHGPGPTSEGAVYLFRRNSDTDWHQIANFVALPDEDELGTTVDISGTTAVAASVLWFDPPGPGTRHRRGAVSIFKEDSPTSWTQTQRIEIGDQRTFVRGVTLENDTLAVGVVRQPVANGPFEFFVEVYDDSTSGFVHSATLTLPGNLNSTGFGFQTYLDDDRLLIGAPGESGHGAAYIYERNSIGAWEQTARLVARNDDQLFSFGYAIALQNDLAIISAEDRSLPTTTGVVFIFQRNSDMQWNEIASLESSNASGSFGYSVALFDGQTLIGAGLNSPGAVYAFSPVPEPASLVYAGLASLLFASRLRPGS